MKKLILTLAAVAAFLLPVGAADAADNHHVGGLSSHRAIDWD